MAKLSFLAGAVVEGPKELVKGGVAVPSAEEIFTVERSLPHGHVMAALECATACGAPDEFVCKTRP